MEGRQYRCPGCEKLIGEESISSHIENCPQYPATIFKEVKRLGKSPPENLIKFIKVELELSLKILKNEGQKTDVYSEILEDLERKPSSPIKKQKDIEKRKESVLTYYNTNIVTCVICERKFYQNIDREIIVNVFDCWHVTCKPCINKYIDSEFINRLGSLKCPHKDCNTIMMEDQIKGLVGHERFESLQTKSIQKMCNLIECCKCKAQFEFNEGNPKDAPSKDQNGTLLKEVYAKDYAINRFICSIATCKTQQCKSCQAVPYHLGMTCKQFKDRSLLKKCRYCDSPLTQKNLSFSKVRALSDICNAKDCQQSAEQACDKINPCNHPCYGFKGEKKCLPCLNEKCANKDEELKGVNGDQYCAVCYVEALSASPCIRTSCGHIFHVKCLKKRFEIRWLTPRIFFNFCLCPLCKEWISVTIESSLFKHCKQNRDLFENIQRMACDRLKFEELEKTDPKLTTKDSPYYNKPKEYAMAIYAYFLCFKCKKPYFGGRKDCMAAMNEANAGGSFNEKELICPNCCEIPVENCPKHGKDFIEFKCKFCCSIAQWFCWGNTHFCEPCHKRQCEGDYVSKYTKQQLPKCNGPGACPVGGNHNGNGQQKMLGCAICRNIKQNHKDF